MAVDVKVPSVGESITEVFIGEWLKKEGETVEKDEAVVEVETDKATLEVPAPQSGVLGKVLKQEGDSAQVGEVIARIEEGEGASEGAAPKEAAAPKDAAKEASAEKPAEGAGETGAAQAPSGQAPSGGAPSGGEPKAGAGGRAEPAGSGDGHAGGVPTVMPAAQRLLEEHGLDAARVPASGPGGRLLKEDVQRFVAQGGAERPTPSAQGAPSEEAAGRRQEEAVPMSPLRRRVAERLVEAQHVAALLTTFNEADMSAVMALRKEYRDAFEKRYQVRLGFMSFFVKAVIDALKRVPQLNAEIRGDRIVYKDYYDIGVAVSSKKGLVVPVVRNAERLSFAELESAIQDFGRRAQENKLGPDELQGGTFTISNGGVFGSLMSTPIVNPPQSGVLGMHTIQERPVAVNGQVEIRPMMYLALTYDHRIVDGREAVTFLKRIKEAVENPARMLLEV
ncbi:MAG TPA: 2-oxoglutarate dehydrogenase complex dihydrolipoyllysine-residue succinyltransferase [Trueperaceae bacterium]|nr:2-oxoglutarate dehydrogenase complex dihydrolipoyllysine-residue succinyltransferase [Trueperaceae bacterium]